jgi:hypothetical protein
MYLNRVQDASIFVKVFFQMTLRTINISILNFLFTGVEEVHGSDYGTNENQLGRE